MVYFCQHKTELTEQTSHSKAVTVSMVEEPFRDKCINVNKTFNPSTKFNKATSSMSFMTKVVSILLDALCLIYTKTKFISQQS